MKLTICTSNVTPLLDETIKSVLAQKTEDFEYFVCQKTITDEGRLKIVSSINDALKKSQGEYFAIVHSGDILNEDYLEKIIGYLDANPIYAMALSHASTINDAGEPEAHNLEKLMEEPNRSQEEWLKSVYSGNRFRGSVVFRRSAMEGKFDDLEHFAELEFIIRLLKKHPIYVLQEKLEKIRIKPPESIETFVHDAGIIQRRHYRKYTAENLPKRKLMLATPFYEMKGFSPYITSIIASIDYLIKNGVDYEFLPLEGDSYVDRARNTICQRFLESDCTHLLLIDSDESWNKEAILTMLNADKDVIGGAYPQKNRWDTWSSIPVMTEGKVIAETHGDIALVEAQCVSAGFMMIHRRVLEKFEQHYPDLCYCDLSADHTNPPRIYTAFFECYRFAGQRRGEDYTFSIRWREMDGKLWIYGNIDFGHYGIKGWYGNYEKYLRGHVTPGE